MIKDWLFAAWAVLLIALGLFALIHSGRVADYFRRQDERSRRRIRILSEYMSSDLYVLQVALCGLLAILMGAFVLVGLIFFPA